MNPFDYLINSDVLEKAANTGGGEWHGPCPLCGASGSNVFVVQPEGKSSSGTGRWFCRACHPEWTDGIEFVKLRDGVGYVEACKTLEIQPKRDGWGTLSWARHQDRAAAPVRTYASNEEAWCGEAAIFLAQCQRAMVPGCPGWKYLIEERGFTPESIKQYGFGWNAKAQFPLRTAWGVEPETGKDGKVHDKIWLPAGVVIPTTLSDGTILRLKVKRFDAVAGDQIRYPVVKGGRNNACNIVWPFRRSLPVLVVESDFDAFLIDQEAGDIVNAVSTGSTSIFPDEDLVEHMKAAPAVYVAFDNDEAGTKGAAFYSERFKDAVICQMPLVNQPSSVGASLEDPTRAKDPGDAWKYGANLREWVLGLLPPYIRQGIMKKAKATSEHQHVDVPTSTPTHATIPVEPATHGKYATFCPNYSWDGCTHCEAFMRDRILFCKRFNMEHYGNEVVDW